MNTLEKAYRGFIKNHRVKFNSDAEYIAATLKNDPRCFQQLEKRWINANSFEKDYNELTEVAKILKYKFKGYFGEETIRGGKILKGKYEDIKKCNQKD